MSAQAATVGQRMDPGSAGYSKSEREPVDTALHVGVAPRTPLKPRLGFRGELPTDLHRQWHTFRQAAELTVRSADILTQSLGIQRPD
jgi:hypothetical protein